MSRRIAIVAAAVAMILALSVPSPAFGASRSSRAAFKGFAAQVRAGLGYCEAAAKDTQILLGEVIQNTNPTQSDLVQLDSADKQAQTACDEVKDDALSNLATLSVPGSISYIKSLGGVADNALLWATDDTTVVLHDIQKIVESSSSNNTALDTQLQTDVSQADSDAGAVRSQMNHAANRLGITNYGGLGLVQWGS